MAITPRKINTDDIKGPVGAASGTVKAQVREAFAFTGLDATSTGSIGLAHNQARLILTAATPEWTIPLQSSVAFPDGFMVTIIAENGVTISADSGVDLNGVDGGSVEVEERADLVRLASDDWLLTVNATGGGSGVMTISDLVTLIDSADGTDLNDLANAMATSLATGMVDGDANALLARFEALDPEDRSEFLARMATGVTFDGDINPGEFWTTDPSGALVGRAFGGTTLQDVVDQTSGALPPDAETLGKTGITYWKKPVRAATTANGTLASAFDDGSTVDGVTLATGDRILIKNQDSGAENGIYVVQASGAPARADDADSSGLLVGAVVMVREGTTNADTIWLLETDAITLGSTSLAFSQVTGGGSLDALLTAIAGLTTVAGGDLRFTGSDTAAVLKTAEYDAGSTSGAVTLNLANGLVQRMTLTGNVTDFNPPTVTGLGGDTLYGEFIFEQDSGGTNTVTLDAAIELEGAAFEGGWDGPDTTGNAVTTYAFKIGPSGLCVIYDRAVRW